MQTLTLTDHQESLPNKERVPQTALPVVWLGFLFAAAFFILEVVEVLFLKEDVLDLLLYIVALGGWIYWLFCVHRFHRILSEMSGGGYPIAPGQSVWGHIIPFYNFYFIFKWPMSFSRHLNREGRKLIISGGLLGALIFVSVLLRMFDGAIGMAGMFAVILYMSSKLRQHMQEVTGLTPEMLPPLPDSRFFSCRDEEREPASIGVVSVESNLGTSPK